MSRRASETQSTSSYLRTSQLPQHPRLSRGAQPIVIHGKSNSTINVSSLPDSKPCRSLFKNLKRLTHRSKPSSSYSTSLEISSPLLVHHKTAEELILSLESKAPPTVLPFIRSERFSRIEIISNTELSQAGIYDTIDENKLNANIPVISITSNNSDNNSEISPKTSLDISPKISKTIPAQNAAKIILNALPPPPPVPKLPLLPSKNPRRLTSSEEKRIPNLNNYDLNNCQSQISELSYPKTRSYNKPKTLLKPPGNSQNKLSFLNSDSDDIPLHQYPCQFNDHELSSPVADSARSELTDDHSSSSTSPTTTPIIPPKASCRNSGLPPLSPKRINQSTTEFNSLSHEGLAFPSSDKLCLPDSSSLTRSNKSRSEHTPEESTMIKALQAENALLSQELDYTKRLLAQERVRINSGLTKSSLKPDPIFSRAY